MSIERNVNGLADYWLDQIEAIDSQGDMDIEKKIKLAKAASQEIREMMRLNLTYKNLVLKAPDLARNPAVTMSLGTPAKLTAANE